MSLFSPREAETILDIGVTGDFSRPESNYFEQLYPYRHRITCVGQEDGSYLMDLYPGIRYQSVQPGQPLPFAKGTFDIVFSNAVLEHTGSREMQAFFLNEAFRVCRRGFFITTPHRWFPIEHHTGIPLLHYLPANLFRAVIRKTRYSYWADENHLNILSSRNLRALLPREARARVETVRFLGIASNLVAYGCHNEGSVAGQNSVSPVCAVS